MPRMLDLFCGRWGWSKAFAARGWECVGVDLVEPPEIPQGCEFVQANVLEIVNGAGWGISCIQIYPLGSDGVLLVEPDFICVSSPCERFTLFTMRNFHPTPPYPESGIKLFNHARLLCEASGVPFVMENVRSAQKFVGNAVSHCGPFYLWGLGVPPILPQGINKGFGKMDREFILKIGSSKSKKRIEHKGQSSNDSARTSQLRS